MLDIKMKIVTQQRNSLNKLIRKLVLRMIKFIIIGSDHNLKWNVPKCYTHTCMNIHVCISIYRHVCVGLKNTLCSAHLK